MMRMRMSRFLDQTRCLCRRRSMVVLISEAFISNAVLGCSIA